MRGLYWFVAPTYKQAKNIGWQMLKTALRIDSSWKFNEVDLSAYNSEVETKIELKGADNEESLKGVGLQGVVLDECATMKSNVFPEVIRPMLMDSGGWAMFIGTPKGKNWFYDIYNMQSVSDDFESWRFPTSVNKYILPSELEQIKSEMPEDLYNQEIMAEFMEDSAGAFRNIRQCITGDLELPVRGTVYSMGVDLAKHQDWTVLTVLDQTSRHLVYHERMQKMDWTDMKLRIQEVAHRYNNALVTLDATGVGDPIFDDLLNVGVSCVGFKFTNESKKQLIERLQVALEQRLITFPRIPVLLDELQRYSYEMTPEGRVRYNAPEGYHDDCVISLALAVHGIRNELYARRVDKDFIPYEEAVEAYNPLAEDVIVQPTYGGIEA